MTKLTFKFILVFLLGVVTLPQFSSNPINESGEDFDDIENPSPENATETTYEKEDIDSVMAAEFLFLVAGDHVFLPEPSDDKEDLELHRNARLLATLMTKLNCTRRVHSSLNNTAQEIGVPFWNAPSFNESHLFTKIFHRVLNDLEDDPRVYKEWLREKNKLKIESVKRTRVHGDEVSTKAKTFYDITSEDLSKVEELLECKLVKKLVLTVELLKQTEKPLKDVPKSAQLYRRRLEIAKSVFELAESGEEETRRRMQVIFDEALKVAAEHFDVLFSAHHQDLLCDTLLKKIEEDEVLKSEFYCIKDILQ